MNLTAILPEILVCLTALAVIGADLGTYRNDSRRRGLMAWIAGTGLTVALAVLFGWQLGGYQAFVGIYSSFRPDAMSWFFRCTLLVSGIFTVLLSVDYVKDRIRHAGEFYALLCLATLGAMFMVAATDMVTFYLALELLSISSFVLVALRKDSPKASEAALKYLVFGALSSGLMLYGLSFLFGMSGSLEYAQIFTYFRQYQEPFNLQLLVAVLMTLAGLGYKVSAVPFHMWTPDVYQGAPMPVTAFLSATSKVAAFAALLRILETLNVASLTPLWALVLMIMAALSMTLGNLVAAVQQDVKRMFAYSSIAHAGYILAGMVALGDSAAHDTALTAICYYLLVYVFMNLGAFAALMHLTRLAGSSRIPDLAGLATKAPWAAFILSCCLLSLTGLPPFAGFTGKFYLFGALLSAGSEYVWLVGVGVLNSVVSLYYYSRLMRLMYFAPTPELEGKDLTLSPALKLVSGFCLAGIVGLFLFPTPVLTFVSALSALL